MASKKKDIQDQLQIEETYRNLAGSEKAAKKRSPFFTAVLAICITAIVAAAGFGGYKFFLDGVEVGKILDNTTIIGIDVGGMTKDDAIAAVEQGYPDVFQKDVTISLVDHSAALSSQLTQVKIQVEDAVDIAYAYGRSGSYAKRKLDQLNAQTNGISADVSSCITINEEAVRSELQKLADNYNSELTQTAYTLTGEQPSLTEPENADISTIATQTLEISKGTPKYTFSIDAMVAQVYSAYALNQHEVTADCEITLPDAFDFENLHKELSIDPVDAVMDTETFDISDHTYGYTFDLSSAKSQFDAAAYGSTVSVSFKFVEPETKSQSLLELLYRDVLSEYTAYTNSSWGRQVNLRLSCEAINGSIIYPGETFSYNPVLGERTPDKGWEKADGYIGNKTVSEYGGGICQASSCLYLCAMLADMEIVERTNHGFISAYMPYGMDATVSWGGPEFLFKNTSDYPIKIEAIADRGNVTVRLLGTDTKDYYVKMEYEVLEVHPYKTIEEEYAPDNKEGYKDGQVIITPYTGYKITTYRCKYDKATNELISKNFEVTSNYARRDKVVCKIVDPTAATQPTETTPGVSGSTSEDG